MYMNASHGNKSFAHISLLGEPLEEMTVESVVRYIRPQGILSRLWNSVLFFWVSSKLFLNMVVVICVLSCQKLSLKACCIDKFHDRTHDLHHSWHIVYKVVQCLINKIWWVYNFHMKICQVFRSFCFVYQR